MHAISKRAPCINVCSRQQVSRTLQLRSLSLHSENEHTSRAGRRRAAGYRFGIGGVSGEVVMTDRKG
jgi:hypothetical protein